MRKKKPVVSAEEKKYAGGVIELMLRAGALKKVRGDDTPECPGIEPMFETQHLHPLNVAVCRPKSPRLFGRTRVETVDKDGHVLMSSRYTREPLGKKRNRNRRRNKTAHQARIRNFK